MTLAAQTAPPEQPAEAPTSPGRIGFEVAAGTAFEVFPPGGRATQRAVLGAPALTLRVGSWLEYAVEGHLSRHVTPVTGNVFGIVPFAFRVHTVGRTPVHLSLGAGQVWTDLAGIRGVEQRRNFITQLGAGIARVRANGSAVSLEARFFHLSNLRAAPPNLGMEMVSVLVGYAFSKHRIH
ncbi:MAG TPA: acyloxyacyl hydrolase [Vicinamibacterales bacterium]|nr:acyloxyacyl hydrolase [Vicinamibacterales bacterium]